MASSNKWIVAFGIIILLGSLSCERAAIDAIQNLNNNRIGILGHGGLSFLPTQSPYPINSFGGIEQAIKGWNADGVEVDVQMSADSVLLLYHDARLESLTNCGGCVVNENWGDLVDCRYRGGVRPVIREASLVRLERLMDWMVERERVSMLWLDLKFFPSCYIADEFTPAVERTIRELLRMLERYSDSENWVVVEAVNIEIARLIQRARPTQRIVLPGQLDPNFLELVQSDSIFGLSFKSKEISAQEVEQLHQLGLRVVLWDIGDRRGSVAAVNKSPDFIQSDNIPLLQAILQ